MNFLEKIAEKKDSRTYFHSRYTSAKQNIKTSTELIESMEVLIQNYHNIGLLDQHKQDFIEPKFSNELMKEIETFKMNYDIAHKSLYELSKYVDESKFDKKRNAKYNKLNENFQNLTFKFESLYSRFLVLFRTTPEKKQNIKNLFINTIRELNLSIKTDDPIDVSL